VAGKKSFGERVRDFEVGAEDAGIIAKKMNLSGGFTGRHFAEAVDVLAEMWRDTGCYRILSFPAAIISTGLRGVIRQLVRDGRVNMVVTTCGTLDHDIARSFGNYFKGDFRLDDEELLRKGYHRLGNVVVPRRSYGPLLERKLRPLLTQLYDEGIRSVGPSELSWLIGDRLLGEDSILHWAAKRKVPVIVPGITDGAVGSQLWLFSQRHRDFKVDPFKDEELMSEASFSSERMGALMLGGGISKHHTIWWAQFRGGLDYAIYITTAVEYDGSLSGALVREAISWGKVKAKARQVTVHGDVTVLLPFLVSAALIRLTERGGSSAT
jgi:deoxyhypusine synthase